MKSIVLLFVTIVVYVHSQTCETPNFKTFCASIDQLAPNHTTDSQINQYLNDVEQAANILWPIWTNRLANLAIRFDFSVCEDCITAMKQSFCSALVPTCGFLDCFSQSSSTINSQCPGNCQTECANSLNDTVQAVKCAVCEANCIASIIFTNCNSFMMSKAMCATLVGTCTCSSTDVDVVCQYFSDSGYTIPFANTLSCTSTPGWCDLANGRRDVAPSSPSTMKINKYIALTVPQAVGQQQVNDPLIYDEAALANTTTTGNGMVLAPLAVLSAIAMIFV